MDDEIIEVDASQARSVFLGVGRYAITFSQSGEIDMIEIWPEGEPTKKILGECVELNVVSMREKAWMYDELCD